MSTKQFIGKWKLAESTNFDDYMKKVGIGWATRKLGNMATPELRINVSGNHWKMLSTSTFKNHLFEFDMDKEYTETTPDGRKMKVSTVFFLSSLVFTVRTSRIYSPFFCFRASGPSRTAS
jgi:Lipocalin / cytosolic fatty-acid binding protein family